MAQPRRADGHVCSLRSSAVVRSRAAGATWKLVIAKAPWAGRWSHTSVIDAAGAIFVLGGNNGDTVFTDVWVSTDGGADWICEG
jgi:hypothetical protein